MEIADFDEHARRVAKAAVQETFLALGVDMSSPGEVKNVQQDFAFVRSSRHTLRTVRSSAITTLVGIILTAIAGLIWKNSSGG